MRIKIVIDLVDGKKTDASTHIHQFQGGWADRIVVRIIYDLPREPRDVC